jgi:hypothetical protein
MIEAMLATDAITAAAAWRPQEFGDRRAGDVEDPIVEPLWTGPRVLALATNGTATLTDVGGQQIDGHDDLRAALLEATAGATVLVEAVLTREPLQSPADLAARDGLAVPKASRMATQLVVGDRGSRKDRLADRVDEVKQRTAESPFVEVALVAVDLIWLDDESLCDVPLLERKRILESVLRESRLVRVGTYVKPPIDAWLGAWRTFGFRRLAFKAANSRYVPGAKSKEWAIAEIPRR